MLVMLLQRRELFMLLGFMACEKWWPFSAWKKWACETWSRLEGSDKSHLLIYPRWKVRPLVCRKWSFWHWSDKLFTQNNLTNKFQTQNKKLAQVCLNPFMSRKKGKKGKHVRQMYAATQILSLFIQKKTHQKPICTCRCSSKPFVVPYIFSPTERHGPFVSAHVYTWADPKDYWG